MKFLQQLCAVFCLVLFSATLYAQADCAANSAYICDDFESYDATMTLGGQSDDWSTWSGDVGGAEEGIVSTAYAKSGTQSLQILGTAANGGPQDVVLLLDNQTSGRYRIRFDIYIPAGKGAYYNIQHNFDGANGVFQWASQITFGNNGVAQLDHGIATVLPFNHDEWIRVDQIIDMDADTTSLSLGGRHMASWDFSNEAVSVGTGLNQMSAIDFFPLDNTHEFYIDDIFVEELNSCGLDAGAIICDNMDGYAEGAVGPQSSFWSTWSGTEGGAEDGTITTAQAASAPHSMLVGGNGAQDVTVQLGNRTQGNYTTQFKMYIPTGADGYFNLHSEEVFVQGVTDWLAEFYFGFENPANPTDTEGMGSVNLDGTTFAYPADTWFDVRVDVDLDLDLMNFWVDGVQVYTDMDIADLTLGMIDFFSASGDMEMYVDDLLFGVLPSSTIACADASLGEVSGSSGTICWGEPYTIELGSSVIPNISTDTTLSGFTWVISTADISNSMDPFGDASFLGVIPGLLDVSNNFSGINDGTGLMPGSYFLTPVSVGNALNVDNSFPGLDFTNGCVAAGVSTELVLNPEVDDISATTSSEDAINGADGSASVMASGGSGTFMYEWSNGATTADVTGLAPGDYMVTITSVDGNGCPAEPVVETITVGNVVGVNDIDILEAFVLSPNPTRGTVNIQMNLTETALVNLQIMDLNGKVMAEFGAQHTNIYQNTIDLSHLANGLYFAKVIVGDEVLMEKIQLSK